MFKSCTSGDNEPRPNNAEAGATGQGPYARNYHNPPGTYHLATWPCLVVRCLNTANRGRVDEKRPEITRSRDRVDCGIRRETSHPLVHAQLPLVAFTDPTNERVCLTDPIVPVAFGKLTVASCRTAIICHNHLPMPPATKLERTMAASQRKYSLRIKDDATVAMSSATTCSRLSQQLLFSSTFAISHERLQPDHCREIPRLYLRCALR